MSVTGLGEISPFGRNFFGIGRIFYEKYRQNDLDAIFVLNRPKFTLKNLDIGYFLS
jgi:hypothetical protein